MEIRQITDGREKQNITRRILEALPDWFGIPEARENYITESACNLFFGAFEGRCTLELHPISVIAVHDGRFKS